MLERVLIGIVILATVVAVVAIVVGAIQGDQGTECTTIQVFNGKQFIPIITCQEK